MKMKNVIIDSPNPDFMIEGNFSLFKANKHNPDDWQSVYNIHNVIVKSSADILRDVMFGDDTERLKKLAVGNLNMTPSDDLINVPEAARDSTGMVNTIFEADLTAEKAVHADNPAIKYIATIQDFEITPNDGDKALITEYGLLSGSGKLFAKKNRAAVVKDNETLLRIIWTIVFKYPT